MSVGMIGVGAHLVDAGDAVVNDGKQDESDVVHTVQQLRAKLEHCKQRRARQAGWTHRFMPTGLAPLDEALPYGGLPCGAITEILAEGPGSGAMSLAMRIAGNCIKPEATHAPSISPAANRYSVVLLDPFKDFYPPAAWQHGIALDRLVVLRARHARDAFWAVDQSLRCSAVAAVIAPFKELDEGSSRRLQLAAESSGCVGIILISASRRTKSFAAVQMLIESVRPDAYMQSENSLLAKIQSKQASRTLSQTSAFSDANACDACLYRITFLKVREGMPAKPLLVDLHHETGALPLHPIPVNRSVAKTG